MDGSWVTCLGGVPASSPLLGMDILEEDVTFGIEIVSSDSEGRE